MLKLGITGGIGSGKTTICKLFELLGVPVYYADEESKKILDEDKLVKEQVIKMFGSSILNDSGIIDRKELAAIVFNNKEQLEKLNAILHPAVGQHFENWLKKQNTAYILKEAAILFESGAYKQVDKVLTVVAPLELKIQRTMKRDGVSKEEVERRMQLQMTDEEKIKRADFVIINNEQELLIPQVFSLNQQLVNK